MSPSTGVGERIAVTEELRAAIRSPSDILNCGTIPDDHALKREALAVRDAFEAATNGMSSPEAEEALDSIPRDAVFMPWVYLVRAIRDFYSGDVAAAEAWASRMPPGSFPSRSARLFRDLDARARAPASYDGQAEALALALFPDVDALPRLVEEIREALDQGLPDFASVRSLRLVRDLMDRPGADPKAAVLAILSEIDSRGSDPDPFIQGLRGLLGESETLRLVALYLKGDDPSLGLLYWLKAAALATQGDATGEGLRAWIAAALVFMGSLGPDGVPESRSAEFDSVLVELEAMSGAAKGKARRAASTVERIEGLARGLDVARPPRGAESARGLSKRARAEQLALFPERG